MTSLSSRRKIATLALALTLCLPLSALAQPRAKSTKGSQRAKVEATSSWSAFAAKIWGLVTGEWAQITDPCPQEVVCLSSN